MNEEKLTWVIRCRYGQFIGEGRLTLEYEKAKKYRTKELAEVDCQRIKRKLDLLPSNGDFFPEGWAED